MFNDHVANACDAVLWRHQATKFDNNWLSSCIMAEYMSDP